MTAFKGMLGALSIGFADGQEPRATASPHRIVRRPSLRLLSLASGGLLSMQCAMSMAGDAPAAPSTHVAPGAAAVIAGGKSPSSEKIMRDSLTGKAIIIVGGSGRLGSKIARDPNGLGSLNPQPLPPDPPPNALDHLKMDFPAAVIQRSIDPRGKGVGSLNPQPLPPVGGN